MRAGGDSPCEGPLVCEHRACMFAAIRAGTGLQIREASTALKNDREFAEAAIDHSYGLALSHVAESVRSDKAFLLRALNASNRVSRKGASESVWKGVPEALREDADIAALMPAKLREELEKRNKKACCISFNLIK